MAFPEPFCRRMKDLLGEEYPAFIEALSAPESVHALRANPAKLSPEALCALAPTLERIPYGMEGTIENLRNRAANSAARRNRRP